MNRFTICTCGHNALGHANADEGPAPQWMREENERLGVGPNPVFPRFGPQRSGMLLGACRECECKQFAEPPKKSHTLVLIEKGSVGVLFRNADGMQLGSTKEGVCYWGGEEDFPHKKCRAFMGRKWAVDFLLSRYRQTRESVDLRDGDSLIISGRDDADARLRSVLTM